MTEDEVPGAPGSTERLNALIQGLVVKEASVLRPNGLVIVFSDGTRLFVDSSAKLELSVT